MPDLSLNQSMSAGSNSGKQRAVPRGAVSWVKLNLIAPLIHAARFCRYGMLQFFSRSKARVQTPHGTVTYFAPNAKCFMRTATVYSKEPETIAWIDSFDCGDTLWDVGANIGIYSIYAAAEPSATVLSFEPSPANFAVLCRSIELNGMDDRISAYCVALGDKKTLADFNMRKTEAGFAGSSLDTRRNHDGIAFEPSYRQAAVGYTIDGFIEEFGTPFPNHIKIDVDGNDHLVLAGASRTLADKRLKSVLVELIGGERMAKGTELLLAAGLKLDPASQTARGNRIFRRS